MDIAENLVEKSQKTPKNGLKTEKKDPRCHHPRAISAIMHRKGAPLSAAARREWARGRVMLPDIGPEGRN